MSKDSNKAGVAWWTAFIISAALLIIGFFMPPIGQIDNSVFSAAGLLIGSVTVYYAILKGYTISLFKGLFEVGPNKEDEK